MKNAKVSEDELNDRARFLSKHILGMNYPYDVYYVESEDSYGIETTFYGCFNHADEAYEEYDEFNDSSRCSIEINEAIQNDVLKLNDILLHELIHHKLWYLGYDYKDGEGHFEDTLKKHHVSSNSDYTYSKSKGKYIDIIDTEYMQKYEDMYQNYKKQVNNQ